MKKSAPVSRLSLRRLAVIAFALHGFGVSAAGCGGSSPSVASPQESTSLSSTSLSSTQDEWLAFGNLMQGSWHSVLPQGRNVRINYRWISNQSALLETFVTQSGRETISVYSFHDGRIRTTHYCGQGNQAHLQLASTADGVYSFARFSQTGVDGEESVMTHLKLTPSSDRLLLEDDYQAPNGETEHEAMELERDTAQDS